MYGVLYLLLPGLKGTMIRAWVALHFENGLFDSIFARAYAVWQFIK